MMKICIGAVINWNWNRSFWQTLLVLNCYRKMNNFFYLLCTMFKWFVSSPQLTRVLWFTWPQTYTKTPKLINFNDSSIKMIYSTPQHKHFYLNGVHQFRYFLLIKWSYCLFMYIFICIEMNLNLYTNRSWYMNLVWTDTNSLMIVRQHNQGSSNFICMSRQ